MRIGKGLICLLIGIFSLHHLLMAQQDRRPKVGLTLSGGGAKGLSHIGILQAIDSAGLKIDYVTGTSMGSIVGALYAIGYSGTDIEREARRLDWNSLFSNQPALADISYEEKSEYNSYIIEIPFEYGKPKLTSGVISGERLWLELARLVWPVRDVKDFSKFNIPFKCIATDVATGDVVTLDKGEIVASLRASMAIPSVFTAVKIGEHKLVDGGVVRNFPVVTAKEMGADIVIGSNVSGGLRKADQLVTPLDILYQLGFYKDAVDFKDARKATDIYIAHDDLERFSAASFGSVDSLLELGKKKGREMYPVFKHLADSLKALYTSAEPAPRKVPFTPDVEISSIHVNGLVHSDERFFRGRLRLQEGGCYSSAQLQEGILNVYGTRFYNLITYELVPEGDGKSRMEISVIENPLSYVKVALNYNTFTNASAIINITQRNFIVPNSRSFVTIAISENPRLRAQYFKYLGRKRNFGFGIGTYYENNGQAIYDSAFQAKEQYRSKYLNVDMHMQFTFNSTMAMGLGSRWEYINLKPRLSPDRELNGNITQFNSYVFYGVNSLDRKIYPRHGMDLDFEAGWVYQQHPTFRFKEEGGAVPAEERGFKFNEYQRALLRLQYHIPMGHKGAFQLQGGGGVNFNYNQQYTNDFLLGGIRRVARNQLPLIGIYEGEVITSSAATIQLSYQYEVFKNIFAIPRAGAALYDFTGNVRSAYNYLSGYGMTVGFSSRLGPIEATMMYSDQTGRLKGQVNIGFNF